jgi:protein-tyrosine phosphatase
MIPLVDLHCHLLAGLDDGPRSQDEAVAMCRDACAEGVRWMAATAHQNDRWQAVTPARIRKATQVLGQTLRQLRVGITVFACAEVMADPETGNAWRAGQLLSIADQGRYLLLEMPRGLFVDLRPIAQDLRRAGVRPILAHPERHPELLLEPGAVEDLIHTGCLVQVSSSSITDPANREEFRALRGWFRRGVAHVLGSDGHSPTRRPPRLAAAYRQIVRWVGEPAADRVCSANGTAILQGLPVRVARPLPHAVGWLPRVW